MPEYARYLRVERAGAEVVTHKVGLRALRAGEAEVTLDGQAVGRVYRAEVGAGWWTAAAEGHPKSDHPSRAEAIERVAQRAALPF